jgi:hypothetical protein
MSDLEAEIEDEERQGYFLLKMTVCQSGPNFQF